MATVSFEVAQGVLQESTWDKARRIFHEKVKEEEGGDLAKVQQFLRDNTTINLALESCESVRKKAESKYSTGYVTVGGKDIFLRKKLGSILKKIQMFVQFGDIAIQHSPETTSLIWAAFRMMLQVAINDIEICELLTDACEEIAGTLFICEVYDRRYRDGVAVFVDDNHAVVGKVIEQIPPLYAIILELSYEARKFLDRDKFARFLRSGSGLKFKTLVSEIAKRAQVMHTTAGVAFQGQVISSLEGLYKGTKEEFESLREFIKESVFLISEDTNKNFLEIHSTLKKQTKADEQQKLDAEYEKNLKWLDRLEDKDSEHRVNLDRRQPNTCNWIFKHEEYKDWYQTDSSNMLWITGNAGFGKSVLVSAIIEELKKDDSRIVLYFFCKTGDDSTQRAGSILRNLVSQLYERTKVDSSELLAECTKVIAKARTTKKIEIEYSKSVKNLRLVLEELVEVFNKPIFILVDALDECNDRQQEALLINLRGLVDAEIGIKVLLASRPEADVHLGLEAIPRIEVGQNNNNSEDIKAYLTEQLKKLSSLTSKDRKIACKAIVERSAGMFRYANLAIDRLRQPWRPPLKHHLDAFPDGLEAFYRQRLEQIKPELRDILIVALRWTILADGDITALVVAEDYRRIYGGDIKDGEDEEEEEEEEEEEGEEGEGEGDEEGKDDEIENYDRMLEDTIEHVKEAGSVFLDSGGKDSAMRLRHSSVKDFVLRESMKSETLSSPQQQLCSKCAAKLSQASVLAITPKLGHLSLALTIFKHLNSKEFIKRHLPELTAEDLETENMQTENTAIENTVVENTAGEEQIPINDDTKSPSGVDLEEADQSTKKEDHSEPTNPDTSGQCDKISLSENVEGIINPGTGDKESSGDEKGPAHEETKTDTEQKVKDGKTSFEPNVSIGNERTNDWGDPDLNTRNDEIPNPERETPQNDLDQSGLVDAPQEDDQSEADSDYCPEIMEEPTGPISETKLRYELTHWWFHLKRAEELWAPEDRRHNEDWDQLWKLVDNFLFENTDAFLRWQVAAWGYVYPYIFNLKWGQGDPIRVAASYGLTALAERILERGGDINASSGDGVTALHLAARTQAPEIVEMLISRGAVVDARDINNMTPLMELTVKLNGNIEIARILLKNGAQAGAMANGDYRPLHYACANGNVKLFELLVAHGADVTVKDMIGETPLHTALSRTDPPTELIKGLIKHGANVNEQDNESQAPLYEAAASGSTSIIKILLEAGANIDDDDIFGTTALHIAAQLGYIDIVTLLVEAGANLRVADKRGKTPLSLAAQHERSDVVRYLLKELAKHDDEGSYITALDIRGRTALHKAAAKGNPEIVSMLLEVKNSDSALRIQDKSRQATPLHAAAYRGHKKVVEILLKHGGDIKAKTHSGQTPIDIAFEGWVRGTQWSGGCVDCLLCMMKNAPNLKVDSRIPLHAPVEKCHDLVVKQMLELGADPNEINEHGWTPMLTAMHCDQPLIAEILRSHGAEALEFPSNSGGVNDHYRMGKPPTCWSQVDKAQDVKVSEDGMELTFNESGMTNFGSIRADHPIPAGRYTYYYEVKIVRGILSNDLVWCAIGVCDRWGNPEEKMPGWWSMGGVTYGYHGDDGKVFSWTDQSEGRGEGINSISPEYGGPGSTYSEGDTVGCGVDFVNNTIFFTKNGKSLGVAFHGVRKVLYPAVTVSANVMLHVNFGQDPFCYTPTDIPKPTEVRELIEHPESAAPTEPAAGLAEVGIKE